MRLHPMQHGPDGGLRQRKYFADLERALVDRMLLAGDANAHHSGGGKPGISDCRSFQEIRRLGFPASSLNALRLIPLVMVAWADNHVDSRERRVVLTAAMKLGVQPQSADYVLVEHWLREKPPATSVAAWTRLMRCVMEHVGEATQENLVEFFRAQMTSVAKASGGYLGFGKVSAKEKDVITEMITSLRQPLSASP